MEIPTCNLRRQSYDEVLRIADPENVYEEKDQVYVCLQMLQSTISTYHNGIKGEESKMQDKICP